MFSTKLKSVDFYRKIPKDLTEASLSGAGVSIAAALFMMFLFGMVIDFYLLANICGSIYGAGDMYLCLRLLLGPFMFSVGYMELSNFLRLSTSTSIVVDNSADSDLLRIVFNISFPALSCEFASVDVSDVLGTNRLNITNKIFKQHIDPHLRSTGKMALSEPLSHDIKHGDEEDEEVDEGSVSLTAQNFDQYSHRHQILVVNFYAPWCSWSNRLKPSWEKTATIMSERYDPDKDARILLGKVDCTIEKELCKRHHIQGYPSIRIFRKGNNLGNDEQNDHESYHGHRDTDSLVNAMQNLVSPIALESQNPALEDKSDHVVAEAKRAAPSAGGCRIVGNVLVKMVPGNLIFSARSRTHSFDASQMNMSHVIAHFSFGKKMERSARFEAKRLVPDYGQYYDRLKNRAFINDHAIGQNVTIEHYLQVVQREVVNALGDSVVSEYEYTAHTSLVESVNMPVAKFHYEPSPMQVLITEDRKSYSHFITNVCAIIGGVFTVAGILDSIFHNTVKLAKKMELGKML